MAFRGLKRYYVILCGGSAAGSQRGSVVRHALGFYFFLVECRFFTLSACRL